MSYSSNKTYPLELTFEQIQKLVETLPNDKKLIIAKKLIEETFKKRFKSFTKKIKPIDINDEDIINEIKSVRKEIYENEGKTKISN
jgi:hypothetical protein